KVPKSSLFQVFQGLPPDSFFLPSVFGQPKHCAQKRRIHRIVERHHHVFQTAHIAEKFYILEGARNAPCGNHVSGKPADVLSVPDYIPPGGLQNARYHIEYSGFSCAVRADQASKLTSCKCDGEVAYRPKTS